MKWKLFACSLLLVPAAAAAQSMNAEDFYQRATALQKKGVLAMFSAGEIKTLMAEGKAAGAKAREQRLAMVAAGQKPRYCPPAGEVTIDSSEFMTRLSTIPATDRRRLGLEPRVIAVEEGKRSLGLQPICAIEEILRAVGWSRQRRRSDQDQKHG